MLYDVCYCCIGEYFDVLKWIWLVDVLVDYDGVFYWLCGVLLVVKGV